MLDREILDVCSDLGTLSPHLRSYISKTCPRQAFLGSSRPEVASILTGWEGGRRGLPVWAPSGLH